MVKKHILTPKQQTNEQTLTNYCIFALRIDSFCDFGNKNALKKVFLLQGDFVHKLLQKTITHTIIQHK